jgi:hypothetical protein
LGKKETFETLLMQSAALDRSYFGNKYNLPPANSGWLTGDR